MQSFLSKVTSEVLKGDTPLSSITFVLPNKRSGLFLRDILKNQLEHTTFMPRILSIEELVKDISGFEILDNVSLVFEFYSVYKEQSPKAETDKFDNFSKWATILLQDFNDLDSNLFDTVSILAYLSDTKRIEQWDPGAQTGSPMVKNYLSFFDKIITYYKAFKEHLIDKKTGYQGLVYRIAAQSMDAFREKHKNEKFVFAAFNALSKAEETIFQELLINDLAEVYWDHDEFYTKSNNQSEQFFKKYQRSWPYYVSNDFLWKANNFNSSKTIHFHGLPKNISQIKHVGSLLKTFNEDQGIEDTAVILGNEKLLPSLLNSLPEEIATANITMGYELQNVSLSTFFQALFKLHLNRSKWKKEDAFYYKDLSALLNDPFLQGLWSQHIEIKISLRKILYTDKSIFINTKQLMDLVAGFDEVSSLFKLIFLGWEGKMDEVIEKLILIIEQLRKSKDLNNLNQEYLFRYFNIFLQLSNLNKNFGFIDDIATLYQIFQQILKSEKLSFQGEPLEGLQIMGLLESRGLDFENLIITSVNEGFLPASGSNNSFIPLDIKLEKKIPTFFEKDAIFSYHFFRLFHRAKNIYLIYNNITDDFGSGEPSRFIRQLDTAKALGQLDQVVFKKKILSPELQVSALALQSIEKTDTIIVRLEEIAQKGYSPTALINYIRNPLDFYKRSILGLEEFREVEETIAAHTFGTIIHDTLEQLYLPYLNKFLERDNVKLMMNLLEKEVERQFKKSYSSISIASGKNYLAFEIAKQFIFNFLNYELAELEKGKKIKITGLEVPIKVEHAVKGLNFDIKLKGKIDRIDEVDGVCRIIDYKTGKVLPGQLKINDWSLLSSDEKFSKSFQVMTYAYMYLSAFNLSVNQLSLETGIISFKNLKEGYMPFNNGKLSQEIMESFTIELDHLILEIFNRDIPFFEKELPVFNY